MTDQPEVIVLNPSYWVDHPHHLAQLLRNGSASRISDPTGDVSDPESQFTVVVPEYWSNEPLALQGALIVAADITSPQADKPSWAPGVADSGQARLTLTVEEAAQALGISRAFAYEAVRRGDIPHIKIGRRVLIPRIALDHLLESATPDEAEGSST